MENEYSQPKFYHFGQDSIILADYASELKFDHSLVRCLDLGAGSGVVGIEIYRKRPDIIHLVLLEMQTEFLPHLAVNLARVKCNYEVIHSSFSQYLARGENSLKYHLIVGNLPYFDPARSRSARDERKNRCRQFEVDNLAVVLRLLEVNLAADGAGLLLLHEDQLRHLQSNLKYTTCWKHKQVSLVHFGHHC